MENSCWPFLTKSPSAKETSWSCPVTCERTDIVVNASTLPIAARSTGTSRSVTFAVTTGTAPPSPRPRPPRPPPPPPVPAAEPEQPAPVIEANRTTPETRMNARLDKVLNSTVRAKRLQGLRWYYVQERASIYGPATHQLPDISARAGRPAPSTAPRRFLNSGGRK